MIHNELSDILTNKALEKYKKTIQEIRKDYPSLIIPTGGKKNGKPVTDYYYNVYTFETEKEYKDWREWAEKKVVELKYKKEHLDFWEMLWGLKEVYLPFYKKEGELF